MAPGGLQCPQLLGFSLGETLSSSRSSLLRSHPVHPLSRWGHRVLSSGTLPPHPCQPLIAQLGKLSPREGQWPLKVTQQVTKGAQKSVALSGTWGPAAPQGPPAGSRLHPTPQPCSMPCAACPAPTRLPCSWSPFFLLIRGLSNDSTVPAILELSLISSGFRNNHHRKTPRAAEIQAGI